MSTAEPLTAASTVIPDRHDARGKVVSIFPLPLAPVEQFLLDCEAPGQPMVIRVIMRLIGNVEIEPFRSTLMTAIARHPLLTCRLQGKGRKRCWIEGTASEPVVRAVSGSVFASESGILNVEIDLRTHAPLQTLILCAEDGVKVIMDAHHAACDGNGLRQVITDWFHLYHCSIRGILPKLPLLEPERLRDRDRFPQPPCVAPIPLKDAIRNLIATIRGRTSRWLASHSAGKATHSETYCVEQLLADEQCRAIHGNLESCGILLNDFVMAASMKVFAQMSQASALKDRITVLNPIDLRRPSDRSLPAANRFGLAFMRRFPKECEDLSSLAQGLANEMTYVRSNYVGVEFLKGLASLSRIPGGVNAFRRLGCFVPSMQWTCLGDVVRGAKRLMEWRDKSLFTGDLNFVQATGMAPFAENVPLSIATCEVGNRITLAIRSNPKVVSINQANDFARLLTETLCEPLTSKEPKASSGDQPKEIPC